ncbi:hypothetical protein JTE90_004677 [Oedothorax gibbosus]|uniref:Uncharacterized protein n=1 Tax=Oedothorax gibbosus TaxID=931172 RepID=A0AAV6UA51_9ARAC|nr:hypothetical protein JTE90_004677 [Oedothorax gibbosus]
MMKRGGFHLRKWRANVPAILEDVLAEEEDLTLVDDDVKVIGMKWNPRTDLFGFKVTPCEKKKNFSKPAILAETSRVFDPIGFISSCVVLMKILLQDVWKQNLAWDQPIPEELNKRWLTFSKNFISLSKWKFQDAFCSLKVFKLSYTGSVMLLKRPIALQCT